MTQQWKSTWEGRTFDHLPTSCRVLWQTQKSDWFPSGKKEKALTNAQRLPNSRELTHQQPTEGATLPTQACDNTCSSSSSAFCSDPFTVIYGALTTVIAGSAARTEPDLTQGSWLSLPGKAGGGTECQSCTHCQPPSEWYWLKKNCRSQADKDNWNGEVALGDISSVSQGYQTCSRAELVYQIITAHSWH